ncbi:MULTISPECIES: Mrp/NBP35 family ATP-binding protein [unclassified Archaeoglobus]|jgi:Mrp family chromosome partitioning ATPase|uniref:Mrp/NBP35 family ATP-binding protein n=1 Tax=unclassified Archaeoglobus TaxID=2643606 RepID=UPI0025BA5F25|nr:MULTISPECIES: Mrp/NBP35 family ATP-binding protein [unclassified Archaeoglobus]
MQRRVTDLDIKEKLDKITFRIAVMSGKGGVGKSTATALLAVHYARQGKKVGILDADFLGPSIPYLFGIQNARLSVSDEGLEPVLTQKYGIRVMSIQFLLPKTETPVIWRGPLIAGMLREFLGRVAWGELDYLLIDLPPGTGDAPLTVMQDAKPNGALIVSTPQELTAAVVEKAINMAEETKTAVLGLVENMSYFECPNCGHKSYIFGKGKASELARKYKIEYIAEIPIETELIRFSDLGRLEDYETDWFEYFPY